MKENFGYHKDELGILYIYLMDKITDQYTHKNTWKEELYVRDGRNLNMELKEVACKSSSLDDLPLANPNEP